MKSKYDPRHLKRRSNFQSLYAWDCGNHQEDNQELAEIISHLNDIDQIIQSNAPKWPIDKINKIDLNLLRLAFWELLYQQKNPAKVVIDEAVELAKEFGTEKSSSFVNAVLGNAAKQNQINLDYELQS